MSNNHIVLANSPESQPVSFDLVSNTLFRNEDEAAEESTLSIATPNMISRANAVAAIARPAWVSSFFATMNDLVSSTSKSASISEDGSLIIGLDATATDLKGISNHLAWLYESQMRQNKEILVWLGEVILDYIARSTHDPTVEEAIEELGFLDRENGIKWKMKTLCKWVIVAQRIPHEIRQLPLPQTYLSEAAMFAHPEDPDSKVKFANIRDAMLLSAAENPDDWSRSKFTACMKELQHAFGIQSNRNEGVASLQGRLIAMYRIQRAVERCETTYQLIGVEAHEFNAWIYNVESELQYRSVIASDPTEDIPIGDGLTKQARERIIKKTKQIDEVKNAGSV
jgi:hypothetical protein